MPGVKGSMGPNSSMVLSNTIDGSDPEPVRERASWQSEFCLMLKGMMSEYRLYIYIYIYIYISRYITIKSERKNKSAKFVFFF